MYRNNVIYALTCTNIKWQGHPILGPRSCLTRLKNLKINVVFRFYFFRSILHCRKPCCRMQPTLQCIVGLTKQKWAEIYENHFKNLQLMHVCTADAWQSGKPRVECATNARVHNFARQFWQLATQRIRHSVSCTTQQQQLHWQGNRKTVDQTHRGKVVSFQSRGNGSCRTQQFVTPGICRHQTTHR